MNDTLFVCLEGLGYLDFDSYRIDYDLFGDTRWLVCFWESFSEEMALILDFVVDFMGLEQFLFCDLSKEDIFGLF